MTLTMATLYEAVEELNRAWGAGVELVSREIDGAPGYQVVDSSVGEPKSPRFRRRVEVTAWCRGYHEGRSDSE